VKETLVSLVIGQLNALPFIADLTDGALTISASSISSKTILVEAVEAPTTTTSAATTIPGPPVWILGAWSKCEGDDPCNGLGTHRRDVSCSAGSDHLAQRACENNAQQTGGGPRPIDNDSCTEEDACPPLSDTAIVVIVCCVLAVCCIVGCFWFGKKMKKLSEQPKRGLLKGLTLEVSEGSEQLIVNTNWALVEYTSQLEDHRNEVPIRKAEEARNDSERLKKPQIIYGINVANTQAHYQQRREHRESNRPIDDSAPEAVGPDHLVVSVEQAEDPNLLAEVAGPIRWPKPAYDDGAQIEYYSKTKTNWLEGTVCVNMHHRAPRLHTSPTVTYDAVIALTRQVRTNTTLVDMRSPLQPKEPCEFLARGNGMWLKAVISEETVLSPTKLGYTVILCSDGQTIQSVPASRLRRRFQQGHKVLFYKSDLHGWCEGTVSLREAKEGDPLAPDGLSVLSQVPQTEEGPNIVNFHVKENAGIGEVGAVICQEKAWLAQAKQKAVTLEDCGGFAILETETEGDSHKKLVAYFKKSTCGVDHQGSLRCETVTLYTLSTSSELATWAVSIYELESEESLVVPMHLIKFHPDMFITEETLAFI